MRVKLRRSGNSLVITWPKTLAKRLNVKEGDELSFTETSRSVRVARYDARFEKTMQVARKIMARDRAALRELARR
jgi:putative addiction module antidote